MHMTFIFVLDIYIIKAIVEIKLIIILQTKKKKIIVVRTVKRTT